jgi:hypothetical protein
MVSKEEEQPYIAELEGEWQGVKTNTYKFIYKDGKWTEFFFRNSKFYPVKVSWDEKVEGWRIQRHDSVAYLSGDILRFTGAVAHITWKKIA